MRTSLLGKLGAFFIFLLIAFVVIGGMAWASWTTIELSRKTIVGDFDRQVTEALSYLDSYMLAIYSRENVREINDYRAFKTIDTITPVARHGLEFDAGKVFVPSDLFAKKAPYVWIDIYFQIDQTNGLTSPEIASNTFNWLTPRGELLGEWPHAQEVWPWLNTELDFSGVQQRVESLLHHSALHDNSEEIATSQLDAKQSNHTQQFINTKATGSTVSRGFEQRKKTFRDPQLNQRPPAECEDVVIPGIRGISEPITHLGEGGIETKSSPLVSYWLGDQPQGNPKLAFVRECENYASTFYQGFIGDWNLLKPALLKVICDLGIEADIEPVMNDEVLDRESSKLQMSNLPVRLSISPLEGMGRPAAWRETRGILITMWIIALGVLVVAGVGLSKLVALTERRMQFAYAVTHELRTPLTTFRLYSDMLSAGLVPDDSKQEYLDTLNRESIRLTSLVEDVLEYARLESHHVKLNLSNTDGDSLLSVIGETLNKRCQENDIDARSENAMTNGQSIKTDVDLVHRIATVLVNNAVRHARGHKNAVVLVRISADAELVHLDVIDSGDGVDRADTRTIFKPFRRGKNADSAAQGGIGLGLAIAKNWATLLGGRLELAQRQHPEYGGAHFRLTIPIELHN